MDRAAYSRGFPKAERVGFESFWFFDRVGRGRSRPDLISSLTAASGVTSSVELGTCILQVPRRHPVELAHRVLSAHYLSGGRLLLGVSVGSTKTDLDAVDGDYANQFRQLNNVLLRMQALWRGVAEGAADLTPWETSKGGPPILIRSWAGSRWIPIATKQYSGWIASAHFTNFAILKEGIRRYRAVSGTWAVAKNIPVDLTATSKPLTNEDHLDLRCEPK